MPAQGFKKVVSISNTTAEHPGILADGSLIDPFNLEESRRKLFGHDPRLKLSEALPPTIRAKTLAIEFQDDSSDFNAVANCGDVPTEFM